MKQQAINKLLNAFSSFTLEEIQEFNRILEDPQRRQLLMEAVVAFAKLHGISNEVSQTSESQVEASSAVDPTMSIHEMESQLRRSLLDKDVYTTNEEVIRAIENGLGIRLKLRPSSKLSRGGILSKATRELRSLSASERAARLLGFLRTQRTSGQDEYNKLFGILTRRE